MQEWIEGLPILVAILFFWSGGAMRGTMMYLIGRLAAAGGRHVEKVRTLMATPTYHRAEDFVNRWGVFAVPLCYVTVGFQSAVLITTGFTKMPLKRWIPGMLVGSFFWGLAYATVGMAVIWAWLDQPWTIGVLVTLAVVAFIGLVVVRHKRHKDRLAAEIAATTDEN